MLQNNDEHRYDYMLNMPHKQSDKRKRMTMEERAAQFGAFRALTGYEDAISETGRLTEAKIELDEYKKAEIDRKLQYVAENKGLEVSVTYFVPDERKNGGEYVTHKGNIRKVNCYEKEIIFEDGDTVSINNIIFASVEGDF